MEVFVSLGSNIKPRLTFLQQALDALHTKTCRVVAVSKVYSSTPWGFTAETDFLNAVTRIETTLPPFTLLTRLLQIEKSFGRERISGQYSSRSIDLDILYYGNNTMNTTELTLPHPHLAERQFVLVPMVELQSGFIHPLLGKNQKELLENCPDTSVPKVHPAILELPA